MDTIAQSSKHVSGTTLTLRQIFWSPLANGMRRLARWRKRGKLAKRFAGHRDSIRFEPLEPRLLLSADLMHTAAAGVALDATLKLADVGGAQEVQLVDNGSGSILGQAALDHDNFTVDVQGADQNDALTIDFGDTPLAYTVNVQFDGGAGSNTLAGPGQNAVWNITGTNSGTLTEPDTGQVQAQFSQVQNLTGAADNQDTFIVGADGSLTGLVDGGAGGFDSLVLDGGTFGSVAYTASGPHSGTIDRDGSVISYAGLEPVTDLSAVADRTFTTGGLTDNARLSESGGNLTIQSLDAIPTFESLTFAKPTDSLTIDLGGDLGLPMSADKLDIQALSMDASLTVNGGDGRDEVTVSGNLTLPGKDLTINAEQITVDPGVTISTVLTGPVDTFGDVHLNATDDPADVFTLFIDRQSTSASVAVDGATIKGGSVTIEANARSDRSWNDAGPGFDVVISTLDSLNEFGGVAIANADATVSLSGATEIDALTLTLSANAHSEAVVRSVGVGLAVAYGESNPTAKVTVGDGAHLNSSGDLTITTVAESRVDVEATQSLLGPNKPATAFDVTLAAGSTTIESTAWVQSGAVLDVGGDLKVDASISKDFQVSSSAGAYEDGSVGGAVALSSAGSAANALLDASADVGGGVEVKADTTVYNNETSASATVGTGVLAKPVIAAKNAAGLANATGSFFQQVAPPPDQRSGGPTKFAFSAAFAYAQHSNLALARIDAGAQVGAHAGDVTVEADILDAPKISARAFIDSQKIEDNNPAGNTKENSLSAAFVLGNYDNQADAHIGAGAVVDATGAVAVRSQTSIPLVIDWLHIAKHPSPSDVGGTLADHANSNFGLQNGIFTSWAQSNASGTKTAGAISVDVVHIDDSSHAYIAQGARVNQDAAYRSGTQVVGVEATNLVEAVHLAGVVGLTFFGAQGGDGGVGGSYLKVEYGGAVTAQIYAGAHVYADALLVRADSKTHNTSIAEAGGKAQDLAIDGAFSLVRENSLTLARIDDGAFIDTGSGTLTIPRVIRDRYPAGSVGVELPFLFGPPQVEDTLLALDTNGDGVVDSNDADVTAADDTSMQTSLNQLVVAEDDSKIINVDGGVTAGKSVGVGFSVAINEIGRDTQALVGKRAESFDTGAVDSASGTIAFDRPHGYVTGDAVAYDPGNGTPIVAAGTYYVIVVDPRTIRLARTLQDAYAETGRGRARRLGSLERDPGPARPAVRPRMGPHRRPGEGRRGQQRRHRLDHGGRGADHEDLEQTRSRGPEGAGQGRQVRLRPVGRRGGEHGRRCDAGRARQRLAVGRNRRRDRGAGRFQHLRHRGRGLGLDHIERDRCIGRLGAGHDHAADRGARHGLDARHERRFLALGGQQRQDRRHLGGVVRRRQGRRGRLGVGQSYRRRRHGPARGQLAHRGPVGRYRGGQQDARPGDRRGAHVRGQGVDRRLGRCQPRRRCDRGERARLGHRRLRRGRHQRRQRRRDRCGVGRDRREQWRARRSSRGLRQYHFRPDACADRRQAQHGRERRRRRRARRAWRFHSLLARGQHWRHHGLGGRGHLDFGQPRRSFGRGGDHGRCDRHLVGGRRAPDRRPGAG